VVDQSNEQEFVGTLSAEGLKWPLTLSAILSKDGELDLDFPSLPYNNETVEIQRLWNNDRGTVRDFAFEGISANGERITSQWLRFSKMGIRSDEEGDFLTISGRFAKVILTKPAVTPYAKPFVRQLLRNCEGFRLLRVESPLGSVVFRGSHDIESPRALTGILEIVGPEDIDNQVAWRREAELLLLHVRQIMSFAMAQVIKVPLIQMGADGYFEQTIWSETDGGRVGQPLIHYLDQTAMFETAVSSFFDPAIPAKGLSFAMEWFAMPARYTEMRLLHALTALENLVEENLGEEDSFFLREGRFETLSKAMRRALDSLIEGEAEGVFRRGLASKMRDLNRRTLFEKAMLLVERWGVSLESFVPADLKAAIKARDLIVHRGRYYEDAAGSPEQPSLWDHILIVRELVARMIFTALGFKGSYLCFIGGQHTRTWPPGGGTTT
jgi:hypothetical protein